MGGLAPVFFEYSLGVAAGLVEDAGVAHEVCGT